MIDPFAQALRKLRALAAADPAFARSLRTSPMQTIRTAAGLSAAERAALAQRPVDQWGELAAPPPSSLHLPGPSPGRQAIAATARANSSDAGHFARQLGASPRSAILAHASLTGEEKHGLLQVPSDQVAAVLERTTGRKHVTATIQGRANAFARLPASASPPNAGTVAPRNPTGQTGPNRAGVLTDGDDPIDQLDRRLRLEDAWTSYLEQKSGSVGGSATLAAGVAASVTSVTYVADTTWRCQQLIGDVDVRSRGLGAFVRTGTKNYAEGFYPGDAADPMHPGTGAKGSLFFYNVPACGLGSSFTDSTTGITYFLFGDVNGLNGADVVGFAQGITKAQADASAVPLDFLVSTKQGVPNQRKNRHRYPATQPRPQSSFPFTMIVVPQGTNVDPKISPGTQYTVADMGGHNIPYSGLALNGQLFVILRFALPYENGVQTKLSYAVVCKFDPSAMDWTGAFTPFAKTLCSQWDGNPKTITMGRFVTSQLHVDPTNPTGDLLLFGTLPPPPPTNAQSQPLFLAKVPQSYFTSQGTAGIIDFFPFGKGTLEATAAPITGFPVNGDFSVAYIVHQTLAIWLLLFTDSAGVHLFFATDPAGPWQPCTGGVGTGEVILQASWGTAATDRAFGDGDGYVHDFTLLDGLSGPTTGPTDPTTKGGNGAVFGPTILEDLSEISTVRFKTDPSKYWLSVYYTVSTWVPYYVVLMKSIFVVQVT